MTELEVMRRLPMFLILLSLLLLTPFAASMSWAEEPPAPAKPAEGEADAQLDARIARLMGELSADAFATRERASRDLEAIGEPARKALEALVAKGANDEATWRAQQILRKIGGKRARPLGKKRKPKPGEFLPPAPVPGTGRAPNPFGGGRTPEEALERLRKMMEGLRGPRVGFGDKVYEVGGLRYEKGFPASRLLVTHTNDMGEQDKKNYTGMDLRRILRRYPALEKHPDMPALKAQVSKDDPFLRLDELLGGRDRGRIPRAGVPRMSFSINGVEIAQTPDGTSVTLTERDESGQPVKKTYTGATLDEIKQKHPEVAKRLGGMSIGGIRPGLSPFTPRRGFGLMRVQRVSEVLATHLGLELGEGAVVRAVVPGSQAEKFGIQRNDIVLTVNRQPVRGWRGLDRQLYSLWQQDGPFTVEVIRRGQRKMLSKEK